jgi:hypothetical protein
MAATADILQRCYTGLETRGDTLHLHPRLSDEITRLDFDLRYRGHWLRFTLTHALLDIRARPGAAAPITIVIDDFADTLHSGALLSVRLAERPAGVLKGGKSPDGQPEDPPAVGTSVSARGGSRHRTIG